MAAGRHAQPRRTARAASASARRGKHRRPARGLAGSPRRFAAVIVVPVVLAGGTTAYAFWSATGSGSATVSTTSAAALTVTASATPPPGLYPGRTVDLSVGLGNTNGYPVDLTKLTTVTITSSEPVGCPADNITLPAAVSTGIASGGYALPTPFRVPAGSSSTGTLTGLLTLATSAPDACQGKTFTVNLSFTGSQV